MELQLDIQNQNLKMTSPKIYYSKVSYALILVIFVAFFGPFIPNLIALEITRPILITLLILVLLFIWILHMFLNTTYLVEGGFLKIKSGFIRYPPVAICEMKKISKTSSLMSAPAASFDRIQITYGKFDEVIISPKERDQFIAELQSVNPELINTIN